jgi:ATP-binding cassette subfamily B protein
MMYRKTMAKQDTTRQKIKSVLQLNRTLGFVWRASPGAAAFSAVLVMIQGLFPLAMLFLIKLIVDESAVAISSPGKGDLSWLLCLVAAAGGVSLLQTICQQTAGLANETLSIKVSDYIYDILHRKSLGVGLAFYENPTYFDTLHRAQMEGPHRPARIVNSLVNLGRDAVSLTAVTGLLIYFHWAVPLILFAAVIPGVLVKIKFSQKMYHWQKSRTQTQREASYLNWLITGYIHAKEIRLFGLGEMFAKRFSKLRQTIRNEKLEIEKNRTIATILAQSTSIAAMFGALGFIVFRAVLGMITIGDLVMYYQAIQRGLGFFQSLLGGLSGLYEDNLFISYFYEFMDVDETVTDPPEPAAFPETIKKGISVENVSFTYPQAKEKALENISFTIAPSEVVALVGKNGAGKSTLAKLLCRLYDPDSGRIAIDGTDIRQFSLNDLRKNTGVIFQDYARYHFTARKNISIGNIKIPADSIKIEQAARKAGAHEFITRLPGGYDTILGKMFENGEELSGGQWQKIALARAFMRDARLMILDEPASSLDADSEYEIFKNFKALLGQKIAVLISHRFSTVKMADKIIVLQAGRICEQGSHTDLLRKNGPYASWFEMQKSVSGLG